MTKDQSQINLSSDSKVLVQGITQPLGLYYAARMKAYGTNVVAGVSTGQGWQTLHGIPVFDLVEQACHHVGAVDTTIIFEESYQVKDVALEAIDAGIGQIILVTGGIPPLDMVELLAIAQATKTIILGPSSSGIIVPGKLLLGTHESEFYTPGSVGLITRGSYLIYEVALGLTQANLGQSIAINLGSEAIVGSSFSHWLEVLEKDKATNVIVLVDQTGGSYEDVAAAAYIAQEIHKPVISYIAGRYTPETQLSSNPSARLSTHLPEAISNMAKVSTAQEKVAVFKQGRIPVAERPSQIPILVQKALEH